MVHLHEVKHLVVGQRGVYVLVGIALALVLLNLEARVRFLHVQEDVELRRSELSGADEELAGDGNGLGVAVEDGHLDSLHSGYLLRVFDSGLWRFPRPVIT